jgi:hypothetical protein
MFKHNREILGHSPSPCLNTIIKRTFSFILIRLLHIYSSIEPYMMSGASLPTDFRFWRQRAATFATALPTFKHTPTITRTTHYSLSQQSILTLRSFRIRHHVVTCRVTNISKDESNRFILNVRNRLPGYMTSHRRTQRSWDKWRV